MSKKPFIATCSVLLVALSACGQAPAIQFDLTPVHVVGCLDSDNNGTASEIDVIGGDGLLRKVLLGNGAPRCGAWTAATWWHLRLVGENPGWHRLVDAEKIK
jgi:hypothetical protein